MLVKGGPVRQWEYIAMGYHGNNMYGFVVFDDGLTPLHLGPPFLTWFNFNPSMDK